jgi:Alpha/beta hydrolase of unknown function (DUF1400)
MLQQLFRTKIVGLKNLSVGLSGSALLIAAAGILGAAPGFAAEKLNLVFGADSTSGIEVPVADLRTYAETKQPSAQLKSILDAATPEQQADFLKVLQTSYPADPVELAKLLDSDQGKQMLTAVATATLRPDAKGMDAIKTALVESAKSPQGFSILGFLEAYPDPTFNIDLMKTQQLVAANQQLIDASRPQLEKVVKSEPTPTGATKTQAPETSPKTAGSEDKTKGSKTETSEVAPITKEGETQTPVTSPTTKESETQAPMTMPTTQGGEKTMPGTTTGTEAPVSQPAVPTK